MAILVKILIITMKWTVKAKWFYIRDDYYCAQLLLSQLQVGAETLVYADINPSSLKPSCIRCIQDIDNYHVEYAQLMFNKGKLEDSQKALREHKTNGKDLHT